MRITVIGGGNMGGAIARGAITAGVVEAAKVTISDPSAAIKQVFAEFNPAVALSDDNTTAIAGADMIVVAVKPWLVELVMGQIKDAIDAKRQVIVSIAAGVKFETLAEYFAAGNVPALFRVIPNTAITLGQSATFICSHGATPEQQAMVVGLFDALGSTFVVEESQMTAMTALSSCGIAYAFKYIDAAMRGGEELGIERREGLNILIQTMKGALAMLDANGTEPQTEIDKVTTPGGITLKGLEQMERSGFSQAVIDGLKASK